MHTIDFIINDNTKPPEGRKYTLHVQGTEAEVRQLAEKGYLQLESQFSEAQLQQFRDALDRIADEESRNPQSEVLAGNGHYIRSLLDKDSVFHVLLGMERPKSISRAAVGPRVWFDAEARVVPAGTPGLGVSWHIHHRVIPSPMPPLFSYPHAIHGLLYLDDVEMETGPICILPGSHLRDAMPIERNDYSDRPGQIVLPVKAGTILLMHCNTWHKTIPTSRDAKRRRLILFGYTPSWIKADVARGVKASTPLTDALRKGGSDEIRELLGEYYW